MKVLITAGGTREMLDSVRVLTNISTGKIGAKIAEAFMRNGNEVIYVSHETAEKPRKDLSVLNNQNWTTGAMKSYRNCECISITNVDSLMKVMEVEVPKADVVIHSAAVSDFTFDTSVPVKVGSNSAEDFVRYVQSTIRKTPKVISNFRYWNESAILVGFKFTVGKTEEELCDIAEELMTKNNLDFVFANDKEMMKANKEHVGFLLKFAPKYDMNTVSGIKVSTKEYCSGKENIASTIYKNVVELLYNNVENNKNKEK
jgi:phosphopantothenate---cysteine ligase (CTP)